MVAFAAPVYSRKGHGESEDQSVAMTSTRRRELLAQSHGVSVAVVLTAGELSEAGLAQVRACLARHELVKVRISANSGRECDASAAKLTAGIPCELVKRIGRVVILYRAADGMDR